MSSDSARRAVAAAGGVLLALILLLRDSPAELSRRVRVLEASASKELALRRLAGSGAAFDRRFFVFLESVRRSLPPRTAGVALYVPEPDDRHFYLAAYALAPVPVALAPSPPPRGWLAAVYGPRRVEEGRLLAAVPGGALVADAVSPPIRANGPR